MTDKPLLRVLAGEAVWPPPIWLMRQAGRYLPEYRALRREADFLTSCLTPDVAAEITMQPIRRFGMDAAILFSDILIVPWALGQPLAFHEGEGPVLDPVRNQAAIRGLRNGDVLDRTKPIMETVTRVRRALADRSPNTSLIGFAGAPFTVACYMVEGRGARDFVHPRLMAYTSPHLMNELMARLERATIDYLLAQIEAGVEAIMLFDSWSGLLPPAAFEQLVIGPTQRIAASLRASHPTIPLIGFPRLSGTMIEAYAERVGLDAVGLDTGADVGIVRSRLPQRTAVQGNLDPLALLAGGPALVSEAQSIARASRGWPHIFNLGHGVLPMTPPEHVGELVDAVRSA